MKVIFCPEQGAKRPCGGVPAHVTGSSRELTQCPVSDGGLLLTPRLKAAALVEGWSLHSLQQLSGLNIINTDRFLKDFVVGFCVRTDGHICGSHVGVCRNLPATFPTLSFSSCVFHVFQPHFCKYLYRV